MKKHTTYGRDAIVKSDLALGGNNTTFFFRLLSYLEKIGISQQLATWLLSVLSPVLSDFRCSGSRRARWANFKCSFFC